ncbi:lipopolysaccharide biosynthesis protein, partial [Cellulomonas sp. P5_C6]
MSNAVRSERMVRDGVLYTLAVVAPMASAVLVTPAVTRVLGGVEYGHVATGIAVYQIAAILFALGLPAAITRDALMESAGTRQAAGTMLVGVGGVALAVVLSGSALQVSGASIFSVPPGVAGPALVSGGALAALTMCQAQLRALARVTTFVLLAIANAVLPPIAGLVHAGLSGPTGEHYLQGLSLVQVLVAAVAVIVVTSIERPSFARSGVARSLRIGLPTVPHQLAAGAVVGVLVLIAGHRAGVEIAGQLQLALLIGTLGVVLVGAFNNSWAPNVYRRARSE